MVEAIRVWLSLTIHAISMSFPKQKRLKTRMDIALTGSSLRAQRSNL
jgi:hypothetical protein